MDNSVHNYLFSVHNFVDKLCISFHLKSSQQVMHRLCTGYAQVMHRVIHRLYNSLTLSFQLLMGLCTVPSGPLILSTITFYINKESYI